MFRIVCNGHRTRDRGALPDACGEHHDAYAEQQHYNDAYALQHNMGSSTEHHIDHNGGCINNRYPARAMCVIVYCDVRNVCVFCSRSADVP